MRLPADPETDAPTACDCPPLNKSAGILGLTKPSVKRRGAGFLMAQPECVNDFDTPRFDI